MAGPIAQVRGRIVEYSGCDLWLVLFSNGMRVQVHRRALRVIGRADDDRPVAEIARERSTKEKTAFTLPEGRFYVCSVGDSSVIGPLTANRVLKWAAAHRNVVVCRVGDNAWKSLDELGFPV